MSESQRVKHLCVVNPKSFPHKAGLDAFVKDCTQKMAGRDLTVHISRFPRDAIGVIRTYAAHCEPDALIRVYAAGGDGILFDCLNGVAELEHAELASMPYGGRNDFIRAFGEGKQGLFRDIALLADAPSLPTDVMRSARNYALNFCAVGLESSVILQTRRLNRIFEKPQAVFPFLSPLIRRMASVSCFFQKPVLRQRYDVSIDGEDFSGGYAAINIANGPCCGGNKNAAVHADPGDGLLDALFMKAGGAADITRMASAYLSGQYRKFPKKMFYRRGRKFDIHSDTPMAVNLDGEVFLDTRLTLEIIPAAVRIVAPAGVTYERRGEPRE
ncbi:MAG: hypothetical protein LBL26_07810 [Peptococcaceae bacterium]|jgi:YegS/Rv2252/BmrU family lipid kinase|nr:hypothetical protein [Peptococcaceae bacterium]